MSQLDPEQVLILRNLLRDSQQDSQTISKKLENMRFRVPESFQPEIHELRESVLEVVRQLDQAGSLLRRGVYEERPLSRRKAKR